MAKYFVDERLFQKPEMHDFAVGTSERGYVSTQFLVADYGLDEARRRAEAECKWLNERAEQWHVDEQDDDRESDHRFRVLHKHKPIHSEGLATVFFVKPVGHDLARSEAERLCKILNDLDASK
jgi:hypothetical protein